MRPFAAGSWALFCSTRSFLHVHTERTGQHMIDLYAGVHPRRHLSIHLLSHNGEITFLLLTGLEHHGEWVVDCTELERIG